MIFGIFKNTNDIFISLAVMLAYLITILCAIVFHEIAHGYAAYLNGDMTAKSAGRLTLNPLKHLNIMGFIMMLVVGFGWAEPVPIDPRNFKDYKKGMVQTSLAGVTCNLILAIISSICLGLFSKFVPNSFTSKNMFYYIYAFCLYLFYYSMQINILLMIYNLLPIYPLDGFRVVETLSNPDSKYVDFMYKYGRYVLLIFIVISYFAGSYSIFSMTQDLVSKLFNTIWRTSIA